MTKAEHDLPIPKLFSNWPSASAANFLAYWLAIKNFPENMSFSLFLSLKEARHKGANLFLKKRYVQISFHFNFIGIYAASVIFYKIWYGY